MASVRNLLFWVCTLYTISLGWAQRSPVVATGVEQNQASATSFEALAVCARRVQLAVFDPAIQYGANLSRELLIMGKKNNEDGLWLVSPTGGIFLKLPPQGTSLSASVEFKKDNKVYYIYQSPRTKDETAKEAAPTNRETFRLSTNKPAFRIASEVDGELAERTEDLRLSLVESVRSNLKKMCPNTLKNAQLAQTSQSSLTGRPPSSSKTLAQLIEMMNAQNRDALNVCDSALTPYNTLSQLRQEIQAKLKDTCLSAAEGSKTTPPQSEDSKARY